MEIEALLAIAMFATAIAALLAGYPVALTLGGVALLFALIGGALGVFPLNLLRLLQFRILGTMENQVLIAVPLFVLMGVVLERSKVAEDLLHIASRLLSRVRGGLAYAVVLVGALLAASTGIVGATVITMTLIALPTMLRQGYDPRLASGTIAASGTLGQIIPPSIVLILLADAISNANQQASVAAAGRPSAVSVGDLFAGALLPGLILVGLYLAYIALMAAIRPASCPPTRLDEDEAPLTFKQIFFGLGAPLLLIIAVLGSILGGFASPTEASAIGAGGAVLLAGLRLADEAGSRLGPVILSGLSAIVFLLILSELVDLRAGREATAVGDQIAMGVAVLATLVFFAGLVAGARVLAMSGRFGPALTSAAHITAMVFLILIGASLFALVFRGYEGDDLVMSLLSATPGGLWGALALTMVVMFLLGFFLDFIEIVYVVVPLVAPPLILLGADPVWLAILMALNLQTSFLTPPFGFALFYLRGVAPPELETLDIWRGAIPFIGVQVLLILLVAAVPAIATWLPSVTAR
ncbi:MAG: TRAP transporter large permease subunit [Pseudomonadota bacterium]